MIVRKKMENKKRSASAWNDSVNAGISFGVTDYPPCLGCIDSDKDGNATIFIYKKECEYANVKIKIVED